MRRRMLRKLPVLLRVMVPQLDVAVPCMAAEHELPLLVEWPYSGALGVH